MTMQRDEGPAASGSEAAVQSEVRHNEASQRFELKTSAGLAVVDYRRTGDTLLLYHTEVPAPLRGGGIGERLVRGTLDEVRKLGLKVVPQCWFVADVIRRRPEYRDLLSPRR
jgi:predicted GNAT family acetyltransferase